MPDQTCSGLNGHPCTNPVEWGGLCCSCNDLGDELNERRVLGPVESGEAQEALLDCWSELVHPETPVPHVNVG